MTEVAESSHILAGRPLRQQTATPAATMAEQAVRAVGALVGKVEEVAGQVAPVAPVEAAVREVPTAPLLLPLQLLVPPWPVLPFPRGALVALCFPGTA